MTLNYLFYRLILRNKKLIRQQRQSALKIPIIIINYNQLYYLEQQVNFYLERKFENIVIVDNASTYPPLLQYYESLKGKATVEYMSENAGHLVFFKNQELQKKYGQGYYVITDADIVPNDKLPVNFIEVLLTYLDKYFKSVTKVGFALNIDNIPDYYDKRDEVRQWEQQYWQDEIEKDIYLTKIDTTFALYKPNYPGNFSNINFFKAIRLGGDYTATHGGWFKNHANPTEEEIYYEKTCNKSASWTI